MKTLVELKMEIISLKVQLEMMSDRKNSIEYQMVTDMLARRELELEMEMTMAKAFA